MPVAVVVFVLLALAVTLLLLSTFTRPRREATAVGLEMSAATPASGKCLGCGGPLSVLGVEQFRIGGTTGGWKLLFGEWAELGETMLDLEVLACTACRRVEFRVPEAPPA